MLVLIIITFLFGLIIGYLLFRRRKVILNQPGESIAELSRSLAHEIRNPLNTIRMNLNLLQEELGKEEHYAQRFSRIESELLRLDGILKSFLDYTKLPSPQFQKVDINDTIHQIVNMVRARSGEVSINTRFSENLPKIQADPALLAEALHNILQNSIEASEGKGAIIVETARTGAGVTISISDRGKGIPPKFLEKIFKPYFSTKRGGIGIGMAVVKKIIEAHSGKIQIQSRLESGTRVIIELPIS